MSVFDPIWPTLDVGADDVRRSQQAQDADVAEIRRASWATGSDGAMLAEAHLIAGREDDRRSSTDGKASAYLLVIAALIPLLTYLESTVWEQKFGTAPKWLSLPILATAVAYVLGAGLWAFRTLNVGAFHTLGTTELTTIWASPQREPDLVREILINTRRNSDGINEKVSCIRMAHIFLRRGVVSFSILILVQVGWYAFGAARPSLAEWLRPPDASANSPVATPAASGTAPRIDPAATKAVTSDCMSEPSPSQKATDAMNGAFGAVGFKGGPEYWKGLAAGRSRRQRSLSETWDALRKSFAVGVPMGCPK